MFVNEDNTESPCFNCIVKMSCSEGPRNCGIKMRWDIGKLQEAIRKNQINESKRRASYDQAFTRLFRRR